MLVFFSVSALPARALTVAPIKLELTGDPGATIKSEFELFNEQTSDKTFYVSFENFEAQGESGTPNFVPGTEGLAMWINAPDKIVLKAGERKNIPFTIKIPQNADPGGHFAAIFWGTAPPQGQKGVQVSVGAKIGILVLLKVSGPAKEGGGILDFSALNKQKFFSALPVLFTYRFQNSGNDRVKPAGEIKITNIFGQTAAELPANEKEGNVLPASVRKFEVAWQGAQTKAGLAPEPANDLSAAENQAKAGFWTMAKNEWNNFAFGYYRAELDLKFGDKEEKASFGFWIIPWQLLILLIVILGAIVFLGLKGIRRYNQWIIAKHTKSHE
ncbi:hypothetical protein KKB43_01160 [Patescibacteria group bacterium]|nr:hypothetical protein [Patescibacteria group bacterium]